MNILKKIIDSSTWFIFFFSVVFSAATVVAQNSIPGDSLFGYKLAYEKVVLASSRFLNKQVDIQIDYVARRFSETTQVLNSKYASESLDRLNNEVESTAYTITLIEDPAERQVAAKKYVAKLNEISTGLRYEQQGLIKTYTPQQQPIVQNISPGENNPTYPTSPPPTNPVEYDNTASKKPTATPTPIPTAQTAQIVTEIDNTQQTIEQTISQMEELIEPEVQAPAPTNTPIPTDTPVPSPTATPTTPHGPGPQSIIGPPNADLSPRGNSDHDKNEDADDSENDLAVPNN